MTTSNVPTCGDILFLFNVSWKFVAEHNLFDYVQTARPKSSKQERPDGQILENLNRVADVYFGRMLESMQMPKYILASIKLVRFSRGMAGKYSLRVVYSTDEARRINFPGFFESILTDCFFNSTWSVLGYENPIMRDGKILKKTMFALNMVARTPIRQQFTAGNRLVFNKSIVKPDLVWEE